MISKGELRYRITVFNSSDKENEIRNKTIYQIVKQNRTSIEANAQAILLRRVEIEANQKLIQENANLIASTVLFHSETSK